MDGPNPYKFTKFEAMDGSKPFKLKRLRAMAGPKPYKFISFDLKPCMAQNIKKLSQCDPN